MILVCEIDFWKKHAGENKYLPFNGWFDFWNFPLVLDFGRQQDYFLYWFAV